VDDEPQIREIIKQYFSTIGLIVLEAGDGQAAFDLFNKEPIDLVISDIRMPILNGLDLLRLIKLKSPDTPVILMTGYQPTRSQELAMTTKADGYLIKPFSLIHLKNIVTQYLRQA